MAIGFTSPLTGGAQTGLSSPTYTATVDVAPQGRGKQWAVTSLGGTQTGVRTHSGSDPFTVLYQPPAVIRPGPLANAQGYVARPPMNVHKFVIRKGANFATNQAPSTALFRGEFEVPAGSDLQDAANIRALASAVVGFFNQNSAGIGDTLVSGVP